MVILSDGRHHHIGLVNLAHREEGLWLADRMGRLGRLWSAYRAPDALPWKKHSLTGEALTQRKMIRQVWQQAAFAQFRRFAKFPVSYRLDRQDQQTCVWFTDLRYVLPALIPPFRYGMCKDDDAQQRHL